MVHWIGMILIQKQDKIKNYIMRKLENICAIFIALVFLSGCNDNEEIIEPDSNAEYSITVNIKTDKGEAQTPSTRAQDGFGGFTNVYDADFVYMHSTQDPNKFVKLPIEKLEECEDCNGDGFRYTFCKNDDGSYTIHSMDGSSSAIFASGEEIYFSSEEYETWEGNSVDASPVTGQSVLVRDETKNKEIYRSEKNYTMQDVFNLGLNGELLMQRKCSAFRIYFLFTELDTPSHEDEENIEYRIGASEFEEKSGLPYNEWCGKIYIGPYFCDTYNINTGEVGYKNEPSEEEHSKGYYVTNEQTYIPFTRVTYTRTEGIQAQYFQGYGVTTAKSDYLITPYDVNSTDKFTFYAFIKNSTDDLNSDINSKYVSYTWEDVPPFNTTQVIVIVYNVKELKKGFEQTNNLTRSFWKGPEKLDIQPAKVICIQE